jgi:hypothetical protein
MLDAQWVAILGAALDGIPVEVLAWDLPMRAATCSSVRPEATGLYHAGLAVDARSPAGGAFDRR